MTYRKLIAFVTSLILTLCGMAVAQQGIGWHFDMMRASAIRGGFVDDVANLMHYYNPAGGDLTKDYGYAGTNVTLTSVSDGGTNGWSFPVATDVAYATMPCPISNGTEFTCCVWVKPIYSGGMSAHASGGWFISDRGSTNGVFDFQFVIDKTSVTNVIAVWTNSAASVNITTPFSDNQWQHFALVYSLSSTTMWIYVNGSLYSSATYLAHRNTSLTQARFGHASWQNNLGVQYHGWIDKVRMYSAAKSGVFIKALYQHEKQLTLR